MKESGCESTVDHQWLKEGDKGITVSQSNLSHTQLMTVIIII